MTRPPNTIQLECQLQVDGELTTCPEMFTSTTWTDAWTHQTVTHALQSVYWELTAGD